MAETPGPDEMDRLRAWMVVYTLWTTNAVQGAYLQVKVAMLVVVLLLMILAAESAFVLGLGGLALLALGYRIVQTLPRYRRVHGVFATLRDAGLYDPIEPEDVEDVESIDDLVAVIDDRTIWMSDGDEEAG